MAERKVKQWITVNGVHVPIFEGESKEEAVKKHLDQTKGKTVKGPKLGEKRTDKGVTRKDVEELTAKKDALKGTKLNAKPITKEEVEANQKAWSTGTFEAKLEEHSDPEYKNVTKGVKTEKQLEREKSEKLDLSTEGTYKLNGQNAPKDLPRVTDEEAKKNKVVEYDGQSYRTQPLVDWDEEKGEFVVGNTYIPIFDRHATNKGSFFVSNDGKMYHDGSQYSAERRKARYAEQAKAEADAKEKQIARNKAEAEQANGKKDALEDAGKYFEHGSYSKSYTPRQFAEDEKIVEAYRHIDFDRSGSAYGDIKEKYEKARRRWQKQIQYSKTGRK